MAGKFAAALRNRGYSHYQLGDMERAQEDFTRSLEIDPNELEKVPLRFRHTGQE